MSDDGVSHDRPAVDGDIGQPLHAGGDAVRDLGRRGLLFLGVGQSALVYLLSGGLKPADDLLDGNGVKLRQDLDLFFFCRRRCGRRSGDPLACLRHLL